MDIHTWELLPSWSRNWEEAIFEDEIKEWNEINIQPPKFEFSKYGEEKIKNNNFIQSKYILIGFKGAAACFLHCNFPKKQIIGSIILPEIKIKYNPKEWNINDTICHLYSIENNENLLILICQYQISSERAYDWNKCLFDHIKVENVIILDKILDCEYHSPINTSPILIEAPFLRKLETTIQRENSPNFLCPYLETPNFIVGAAAAIMTFCELRKIKATLFVSLEDSRLLEIPTLLAFEPILIFFNFQTSQQKPKRTDYLKILEKLWSRKPNTLYI